MIYSANTIAAVRLTFNGLPLGLLLALLALAALVAMMSSWNACKTRR
jgi:hypothetical protein